MTSDLRPPTSGIHWPTALPLETAIHLRGRLERGQSQRALSLAVRHPRDLPEVRAAFGQFSDAELVLLVHPEGLWAIIARREPAARASAKQDDLASVRLARNTAPFVARPNR
jgi:hypothetical protein